MATSVKLENDLETRVQRLAERRHRPAQALMQEAIRDYVEREEAKESFVQEAQSAWQTYQENGRHLTGDEVQDWLNTWGTEKERKQPDCHD